MNSISKLFLMLVLAIILSLLVLTIPALPALAAGRIELDPEYGEVGDYIDIYGYDFEESTPTDEVEVDIYFPSQEADTGDDIDEEVTIYAHVRSRSVDENGEFSTYFRVPARLYYDDEYEDVHAGIY